MQPHCAHRASITPASRPCTLRVTRQATKRAKPDGQYRVTGDRVLEFTAELRVDQLHGGGVTRGVACLIMGVQACSNAPLF
jgi:hypothetical protein